MILFDDLGEFLRQIPLSLLVQICISGLLLVSAMVYFGIIKPRRKKRQAKAEESSGASDPSDAPLAALVIPSASTPPPLTAAAARSHDDLMPDLDLLLDTADLAMPAPAAPPPRTVDLPQATLPVVPPKPAPAPMKPAGNSKSGRYRVKLRTGQSIEAEEAVAVLRDPRDGRLIVYIKGVGYRTLIDTPDVKEQFVKLMRELSDVVTKPDTLPAEDAGNAPPMPELDDLAPVRDYASPAERLPGDLPAYKLDEAIKPQKGGLFAARPKYEPQPVPELNIAASIEAFLQHKLQTTQAYPGRSIHVHSAPGGGVKIEVDRQYFDAVGDVDDDDVRAFLTETIQEWQARQ